MGKTIYQKIDNFISKKPITACAMAISSSIVLGGWLGFLTMTGRINPVDQYNKTQQMKAESIQKRKNFINLKKSVLKKASGSDNIIDYKEQIKLARDLGYEDPIFEGENINFFTHPASPGNFYLEVGKKQLVIPKKIVKDYVGVKK